MNHRKLTPDEQQVLQGHLRYFRRAKRAEAAALVAGMKANLAHYLRLLRPRDMRQRWTEAHDYLLFWARVSRAFILATSSPTF